MAKRVNQKGFSLIEVLIALGLVAVLSVIALNAMTPWLKFKQTLDTDRKLQDMRQALQSAYQANAMTAEDTTGRSFLGLVHDTSGAGSACNSQANALASRFSTYLPEAADGASNDGFTNPLCFFITPQLSKSVEGVTLYYRMLAIVSTGQGGVLSSATSFDPVTGKLTLGAGNRGVVVDAYSVQYSKYRDTLERVNRISSLYETYFLTRFMNTADRDITRDYFYKNGTSGDTGGSIYLTSAWTPTIVLFSSTLGLGAADTSSPYESSNSIDVGNNSESITINGITTTVRSPVSLTTGATPPYTALLRAKLPGPSTNYLLRAVVGTY
jgi:prepilin-type N-terminal cleavage/methylation domain-containing protein